MRSPMIPSGKNILSQSFSPLLFLCDTSRTHYLPFNIATLFDQLNLSGHDNICNEISNRCPPGKNSRS